MDAGRRAAGILKTVTPWIAGLARIRRALGFVSAIALPFLFGASEVAERAGVIDAATNTIVLVCLFVLALSLGIALFFWDRSPAAMIEQAAAAIGEMAELKDEQREAGSLIAALSGARAAMKTYAEIADIAAAATDDRRNLPAALVEVCVRHWNKLEAEREGRWSVALYLWNGSELVCEAMERNFDTGSAPRRWRRGDGHVGMAFQKEDELVHGDIATETVFQAKADQRRDYDAERYRSVVSVPVRRAVRGDVVGVVVATLDRSDAFDHMDVQVMRDLAQAAGSVLTLSEIRLGSANRGDADGH